MIWPVTSPPSTAKTFATLQDSPGPSGDKSWKQVVRIMVTCHLQEIDPINGGEKEGKEKNRHPSLFFSLSIFIPLFFVIPPSFLSLPSQFILD